MSYRNTLQADTLKLVAKKLQSSLAVEGNLPEDGLAAYDGDRGDLMMALARKIVSGEGDTSSRRPAGRGRCRRPDQGASGTSRAIGGRGGRCEGHHLSQRRTVRDDVETVAARARCHGRVPERE